MRRLLDARFAAMLAAVFAPVHANADERWLAAWGAAPLHAPMAPNVELSRPPPSHAMHAGDLARVPTVPIHASGAGY
jgi:hypothetical protein